MKKITFTQVFMLAVVLLLAVGLVYNNVSLHEAKNELSRTKSEFSKLEAEGDALWQQLNQKVNTGNIDELASELGMVKVESYQIRHVDIQREDTMSASKEEQGGLMNNIVRSFNIVVEYLK